jgi:hypothetical protein
VLRQGQDIIAVAVIIAWLKMLKFIRKIPVMGPMIEASFKCVIDPTIWAYLVFFLFFTFAFTMGGMIAFGDQMEMYRSFFPAFIVMYQQLLGDGYMEDMQKSRFAIGTLFYLVLSVIGALILTNVLIGVVCVVYEERAEAADEDWRREINSLMGDAFLAESSWNKLTERKTSKWWRRFFKKATRVVHNIMRRKPVFDDDDDEEEALVRLRGNSNASRFAPALIAFLEEQADGGGGGGGSGGATSDGTGSRTGERTNNRTSSGAVVSRSSNKVVPILPDDGSESRPSNGKAATNSTPEPKSASDFRACLKTLQSHAEYQHSGANPSMVHRDLILRDDSSNLFRFDHWSKKSKQAAGMVRTVIHACRRPTIVTN